MTFFWSKVYGLLGKTPYIYPRYQVWGVMDLGFEFWRSPFDYHPPYSWSFLDFCINSAVSPNGLRPFPKTRFGPPKPARITFFLNKLLGRH